VRNCDPRSPVLNLAAPACPEYRVLLDALRDELALLFHWLRCERKLSGLGAEEVLRVRRVKTDRHFARALELAEALNKHQEAHQC
jgi:hypothetical protein